MQGVLKLDDNRAGDGFRAAKMLLPDGNTHDLWFRSHSGPLSAEVADIFLMASLQPWMHLGVSVHVEGTLTRRLLIGLEEWQNAWARWKPERYQKVAISCDEIVDDSTRSTRAIAAFSGGVDSTFTVHQQLTGAAGWGAADLRAALLVQGFDIPLSDEAAFLGAVRRAGRILGGTGVEILSLSTNARQLTIDWEDSFGILVAASLASYAPKFGIGLIGSGKSYDHLVMPWGSSPILDPLTSTGFMEIRHEGAGATRTEKVEAIGRWQNAAQYLRVCYQGLQRDRNCGRCEKCIRTMLNFRAVGLPVPPCFDRTATDADIRALNLPGRGSTAKEWGTLIDLAEQRGIQDSWLRVARYALRKGRMRGLIAATPGARRSLHRLRGIRAKN